MVSGEKKICGKVPAESDVFILKVAERSRKCAAPGAAERQFHHHDRKAENRQEKQIQKNEQPAAVLPRDVGKTPDIAQSDGAACGHQNESQSGRKLFP